MEQSLPPSTEHILYPEIMSFSFTAKRSRRACFPFNPVMLEVLVEPPVVGSVEPPVHFGALLVSTYVELNVYVVRT